MSNFTLKSLESFDKKSADKIWSKNDKEIKVAPLMPIRVKGPFGLTNMHRTLDFCPDKESNVPKKSIWDFTVFSIYCCNVQ